MLKTKKINDEVVKPVKVPSINTDEILGYDTIPKLYSNIFICAKRESGKTNVLFKILKDCCDKNTHVIVFCGTHDSDAIWQKIKEHLDSKQIPSTFFDSIIDHENKDDLMEMLIETFRNETKKEQQEIIKIQEAKEEELKPKIINYTETDNEIKIKIRKPKKKSCKYFVVFDDISNELKNKNLVYFLKIARHPKAKVLISTQYIHDLKPEEIKQMNNILLFKGHTPEKLKLFHEHASLSLEYDKFLDIYNDATKEKYNFLFIDSNNKYRKNFNEEYEI